MQADNAAAAAASAAAAAAPAAAAALQGLAHLCFEKEAEWKEHILSHLDPVDLVRLCNVSKSFRKKHSR